MQEIQILEFIGESNLTYAHSKYLSVLNPVKSNLRAAEFVKIYRVGGGKVGRAQE